MKQVPVAQLDRVLASEANVEKTQVAKNSEVTTFPKTDTPIITPISSDFPPELQEIIDRWETLPEHIKQAITSLIQANNTEVK